MTFSKRRVGLSAAGLSALLLVAAGCSSRPTYPKERLAELVQQEMDKDGLHTSVRFVEHTLAVQLAYPGSLSQDGTTHQLNIGPDFDEASRKVITVIQRVLLSSDAEVRFYVLLMSDPKVPGAYFTMVRYMDDVRKAYALMLDTPEIFARTIFELNFIGPNQLTIEQYVPRDIRIEEFLSWQLARRIQHQLTAELQQAGVANVGRCGGQFQNGEFSFLLDVVPTGQTPLDDSTIRQVFLTSTNVIANVLSSYHFENYQAVRLIHPLTGRSLLLPKTRLELFR